MDKDSAILVLSSLASDLRHEMYRLIARNGSKGMVAGDIASTLGCPPNIVAYHLGECLKARLVRVQREGRYQRYYADTSRMRELIGYLRLLQRAKARPKSKGMNVLFLCTGNSCRSILAEATFNHLAPAGWRAMSAGSQPTGQVNPRSLALLAREGIATGGLSSKSWDNLPAAPDIVVTVCAAAAGETCPAYLGPALRTHWGVDDPARATGTDDEIDAAFVVAYRILRSRIEAFLALPLAQLQRDRARLKAEMDRIGTLVP